MGLKYTFLITTYNRYDKLTNLLKQISQYDVNVLVLDDGSDDLRYDTISKDFNVTHVKHNKNWGRLNYHNTIKELLSLGLVGNSDYYVKLVDDFILCDDFIDKIDSVVGINKIINIFSIHTKMWGFNGYIDGTFVCDKKSLKEIIKYIPNKTITDVGRGTGVWELVTKMIHYKNKSKIHNLNYSLVQHVGNDDSKLHPKHRLEVPIVAKNFYNDFKDYELKIL